jgi:hypothetical protein
MRPVLAITAAVVLSVVLWATPLSSTTVRSQNTCPPVPPPGATVHGGLVVSGACILDHVTVDGGVTVTATGHLELEHNSTVHGGVTVEAGGELDVGHTIASDTATFTPNTIDGGITFTNGSDMDLENATVHGAVSIVVSNTPNFSLSICGSALHGTLTLTGVQGLAGVPALVGDPGEPLFQAGPHPDCLGNTIEGAVVVTNSSNLELEGNTIHGSVSITNSTVGFSGNTITGSTHCAQVSGVDSDDTPSQCAP